MPVSVTVAATPDLDELAEVAAATFPLACPPSSPPDDVAAFIDANLSPRRFADYLADPARTVLTAREDGRILGYAILVRGVGDDPDVARAVTTRPAVELSKIYVLADRHGTGVSTMLMNAAVQCAAEPALGVCGWESTRKTPGRNGFTARMASKWPAPRRSAGRAHRTRLRHGPLPLAAHRPIGPPNRRRVGSWRKDAWWEHRSSAPTKRSGAISPRGLVGHSPRAIPTGWPQSLRTAVSILLSSRFSMWMAWGPELTFFCNAAYRRDTLGHKYPWALGRPAREVWAEIWDDIGPRIDRVLDHRRGHLGRGASAVPGALRLPRGDLPHLLLQPAARRRRTGGRHALRGQRGHRAGDRRAPDGDAARPGVRPLGGAHRGGDARLRRPVSSLRNRQDLPFTLTYLFDDGGDARLAGLSGIDAGHPAAPPTPGRRRHAGLARRPSRRAVSRCWSRLDGADLHRSARRRMDSPPREALVVPLPVQGGVAVRVPGGRAQPLPAARRGLPRLHQPGRRPPRRRHRQRPQLSRTAAPGRGTRRARPRQDHVLLQHQPRVPHPHHADPRTGRRTARPRRRHRRPRAGASWTSSTATGCAWPNWSTRCWTSPASRPAACRPATSRSTWPR